MGFLRYGRLTSYHTRGAKLAAYLGGASALVVFGGGPALPFRLATGVLVLAELEEIAITAVLPAWHANVRSLTYALALRGCGSNESRLPSCPQPLLQKDRQGRGERRP